MESVEVTRLFHDLVALIATKRTGRVEFDLVPEQARKFAFGSYKLDISDGPAGFELHQHIVLKGTFSESRESANQGETADVVFAAELREPFR